MNEFLKEYISLKENFIKQNESSESVLALYEFADRLSKHTKKEAMEVLVDVYQQLYMMESVYKLYAGIYDKKDKKQLKKFSVLEDLSKSHGDRFAIKRPLNAKEKIESKDIYLKMNGREIFKFAVRVFPETVENVLEQAGITADDVDLFIPHQANIRIIESIAKRFKQPLDKFFVNLNKYGNTSAGSIPIALDEAIKEGKLKKGDKFVATGFGGGLTYGSIMVEISK